MLFEELLEALPEVADAKTPTVPKVGKWEILMKSMHFRLTSQTRY
jgi:hypothetical protein